MRERERDRDRDRDRGRDRDRSEDSLDGFSVSPLTVRVGPGNEARRQGREDK